MDLIIKDDEGRILYGHQLITLIMASGNKSKVTLCDGIEAEAFIAYVATKFPENQDVQALQRAVMNDDPPRGLDESRGFYLKRSPTALS